MKSHSRSLINVLVKQTFFAKSCWVKEEKPSQNKSKNSNRIKLGHICR